MQFSGERSIDTWKGNKIKRNVYFLKNNCNTSTARMMSDFLWLGQKIISWTWYINFMKIKKQFSRAISQCLEGSLIVLRCFTWTNIDYCKSRLKH